MSDFDKFIAMLKRASAPFNITYGTVSSTACTIVTVDLATDAKFNFVTASGNLLSVTN